MESMKEDNAALHKDAQTLKENAAELAKDVAAMRKESARLQAEVGCYRIVLICSDITATYTYVTNERERTKSSVV